MKAGGSASRLPAERSDDGAGADLECMADALTMDFHGVSTDHSSNSRKRFGESVTNNAEDEGDHEYRQYLSPMHDDHEDKEFHVSGNGP